MTIRQCDRGVLAILIAARDGTGPIPRSWKITSERLQREGKLRVTSTKLVFRISVEGVAEIARLERLGVTPLRLGISQVLAHAGGVTTTGDEGKRLRASGER